MKKIGLVVLAIGLVITLFTGFNFITREKIGDIGCVQISHNKNHYLSWSPIVGIVVMAVGGAAYLFGTKKI